MGCFAGQRRGHEFSDILAEPALSIEQTHFLKVCPGNKWYETNTISRDRGDKLADDGHATPRPLSTLATTLSASVHSWTIISRPLLTLRIFDTH